MPWCEDCSKYWAPSSMNEDGTCPSCGVDLDPRALAATPDAVGDDVTMAKTPWHFKLMVVALVVYLGWRFVEIGIEIFT